MTDLMRVVMAQDDFLVGDCSQNVKKIRRLACRARDEYQADVVLFPELAVTGYPPEDLLLNPAFLKSVSDAMRWLEDNIQGVSVVVGYPRQDKNGLYNSAAFINNGKICNVYDKHCLPNYSVFDEKRYFLAGKEPCVFEIKGVRCAVTLCEDLWESGPAKLARNAGAEVIFNLNASPYDMTKSSQRATNLKNRFSEVKIPIFYLNLVGGQDELVFDGGSQVINESGELCYLARRFENQLVDVKLKRNDQGLSICGGEIVQQVPEQEVATVYRALVLGVRDYVRKNGFSQVVVGLSGGVDSALTLSLAVDALGCKQVSAISMPSRYTQDMSNEDAWQQCKNMDVRLDQLPIENAFKVFLNDLSGVFEGLDEDITEENIQARCRGIFLMAVSNKTNKMVLTTGNKSEMAVGYSTLYGDMAGGFAPLKDVPKILVYKLANYRNKISHVIPNRVLERPPSAELSNNQKDEDNLPPYEVLDPILEMHLEQNKSLLEIAGEGFDPAVVERVLKLVKHSEYKRRQAPPGIKITHRAFGKDRRYPLTSGFYESRNMKL